MVGRNDSCPCGSGKKYKKCCLGKNSISIIDVWKGQAKKLLEDHPKQEEIIRTFFAVTSLIKKEDWQGACHASSCVLHVLLTEQGVESVPCLGEARIPRGYFDHSWIEIDGAIYDAAIMKPLDGTNNPPVFKGYDLENMKPTIVQYGVSSPGGFDAIAFAIQKIPFADYMDGFPAHEQGLWGIAKELAKEIGIPFNIEDARAKHATTEWKVMDFIHNL